MGKGQINFFFWDTLFKVSISFQIEEKRLVFGPKLILILKYFKTQSSYKCPIKNKS